jgi:hypothetical protein
MTEDLYDHWHRAACNELEHRVQNRTFWLWVRVEDDPPPSADPQGVDPATWRSLADGVEEWLEGIDPDTVDADNPPSHQIDPGGAPIELNATPKKLGRRGTDPLIGNLYPGMTYPRESYTAGPAPELPDS